MSENGTIYISMMKNWVSHIFFFLEKGAYRLPGTAENGGYSGRTSAICHIKVVTPPPPPRELDYTEGRERSGSVVDCLRPLPRVRASPESLRCVFEQDTLILA